MTIIMELSIKHLLLGNYLCMNSGSSLTNWIKSEGLYVKFVSELPSLYIHNFIKNTVFNPYNSYSWTSYLFSTLNTSKKIPKDIQYTYDCKLKKICEMLLTTLEHNQHDVIDVIWRLPVWNVKIRRYFGFVYASSLIQFN